MSLFASLFAALVITASAALAQSSVSSPAATPSSNRGAGSDQKPDQKPDQKEDAKRDLPVSLDKIRDALTQAPAPVLRGLNEQAHFKVEIVERQKVERQKIEELLATLDFRSGPAPPGGLYAYEQQRIVRPPVDNPLAQPYAAFSTSELLTLAIESLIVKYLGGRALAAVTSAERARAEQAAREEVARAMADVCAAQPNRGAGFTACEVLPASR
jgi:hypothetical protein